MISSSSNNVIELELWNLLCDLVLFVHFKKREKYPWSGKSNTSPWMFFTIFKLYKWYHPKSCKISRMMKEGTLNNTGSETGATNFWTYHFNPLNATVALI